MTFILSCLMALLHFLACLSLCWRAWKWTRAHPEGSSARKALRKPCWDALVTGLIFFILSLVAIAGNVFGKGEHWGLDPRGLGKWNHFVFFPAVLLATGLPLLPCLGLNEGFRSKGNLMFMAAMGGAIFSLIWPVVAFLIIMLLGPSLRF